MKVWVQVLTAYASISCNAGQNFPARSMNRIEKKIGLLLVNAKGSIY